MGIIQQNGPSAAKLIIERCKSLELFTDPMGVAWVGLPGANGYPDYTPLKSTKFTGWIAREFYGKFQRPAGQKALEDARAVLAGLAADTVRRVYNRIANLGDCVYVDLGTGYVEITPDGWALINKPPVPFRRPAGMLPLPMPAVEYEGRLEDTLGKVTGLSASDLTLIIAWLMGALGASEYPILALNGEQGSGKSTLAEILKRTIDPSEVTLRAAPRDEQALAVAAYNSWVVALDNLSHIPDWLSDALCRISTGAGYSARKLYFDLEETLARTQRPVILNGIPELASRGDLQNRLITITMPAITDIQRRGKGDILADFEKAHPVILAQLFDAVSAALKLRNAPLPAPLPRMADFATWAAHGCLVATYGGERDFIEAYNANQAEATLALLDTSPLAREIQEFIAKRGKWTGTTLELKDKLSLQAVGTPMEKTLNQMSAKALNNELRRLAPVLRRIGIEIEFRGLQKVNGIVGRFIEINDLTVGQKVSVP